MYKLAPYTTHSIVMLKFPATGLAWPGTAHHYIRGSQRAAVSLCTSSRSQIQRRRARVHIMGSFLSSFTRSTPSKPGSALDDLLVQVSRAPLGSSDFFEKPVPEGDERAKKRVILRNKRGRLIDDRLRLLTRYYADEKNLRGAPELLSELWDARCRLHDEIGAVYEELHEMRLADGEEALNPLASLCRGAPPGSLVTCLLCAEEEYRKLAAQQKGDNSRWGGSTSNPTSA